MTDFDWRPEQARKSLNRIFPGVEEKFADRLVEVQGCSSTAKFTLIALTPVISYIFTLECYFPFTGNG